MNSVVKSKHETSPQIADWRRASVCLMLLLGFMCASSAAFSADQQIEEVHTHIESPAEKVVGQSVTGQPIKMTSLQFHVRYDDLDLTSKDGVKALRKRVTKAALRGCADLGKKTQNLGNNWSCSAAARRSANSQIDQAIERARYLASMEHNKTKVDQAVAQTDFDK